MFLINLYLAYHIYPAHPIKLGQLGRLILSATTSPPWADGVGGAVAVENTNILFNFYREACLAIKTA